MDLGIKGRKAIVCAASRGLGKACATALAREGCSVVINGLDPERLERASPVVQPVNVGNPGDTCPMLELPRTAAPAEVPPPHHPVLGRYGHWGHPTATSAMERTADLGRF